MICLDSVNRIVEIRTETLTGTIHIRDGQVCHAQAGDLLGQEAFFKRAGGPMAEASLRFPVPREAEVTIDVPWEHLLIEAMRFLDESSGMSEEDKAAEIVESLLQKVQKKKMSEKIRLAMTAGQGNQEYPDPDSNRMIQVAVICNAKKPEGEVAAIACSRHVDEEVLRRIAADKEWIRLYPVRLALATNPKTPITISRRLVATLNHKDLRNISRSKSVPNLVASEARRHLPTNP